MSAVDPRRVPDDVTFAQHPSINKYYDEFVGIRVAFRVVAGPFHPPCKNIRHAELFIWSCFFTVGHSEGYMQDVEMNE
jgi:hypothetical protein